MEGCAPPRRPRPRGDLTRTLKPVRVPEQDVPFCSVIGCVRCRPGSGDLRYLWLNRPSYEVISTAEGADGVDDVRI